MEGTRRRVLIRDCPHDTTPSEAPCGSVCMHVRGACLEELEVDDHAEVAEVRLGETGEGEGVGEGEGEGQG